MIIKFSHPILSTHVANIALNKDIALPFLQSAPQDTNGFTEYSAESYVNDKLHVAMWMIYKFSGSSDEKPVEPWVSLPEWNMPQSSTSGVENMKEYDPVIKTIESELKMISNVWSKQDPAAINFLMKMTAQIRECIWYTNQRLAAIQICAELPHDPQAIFSRGEDMAFNLMTNPMVGIAGYLLVKNEMNSKRILAVKLLKIIMDFLPEKAIQEGYTSPTVKVTAE